MAIETSYIYSIDNSGVLAWLQENAVPDYFDKVEADATTTTTVNCYVGDTVLLQISYYSSGYCTRATVTTASGATKTLTNGTSGTYINYGCKCAGGLALSFGYDTATTLLPCLMITKDNEGNTAIVCNSQAASSYLKNNIAAVTAIDKNIVARSENPVASNATTLVPLVCGCSAGECRYTPNVLIMPYAQYTDIGKLVIDGVEYLSNGVWVMKDEAIGGGGATGDYATKSEMTAAVESLRAEMQTMINTEAEERSRMDDVVGLKAYVAFGLGAEIAADEDLNDYTEPSSYRCRKSATASTLVNCPVTVGFRLEVRTIVDTTRLVQTLYANNDGADIYVRTYTAAGWGSWRQI